MEVSGLLPLAGACGVVVVVRTPLLVVELLQIGPTINQYWIICKLLGELLVICTSVLCNDPVQRPHYA